MVQFPVLKPPSQEDPANNHIIINFTRRYEGGLKASPAIFLIYHIQILPIRSFAIAQDDDLPLIPDL